MQKGWGKKGRLRAGKPVKWAVRSMLFWCLAGLFGLGLESSVAAPGDALELLANTFILSGTQGTPVEVALNESFENLEQVLEFFYPVGVSVRDYSVLALGPRQLPRLQFIAEVDIPPIRKTGWFIGDAEAQTTTCELPFEGMGRRIYLHLTDSDSFLFRKVSDLYIDFCFEFLEGNQVRIRAVGSRIEGSNYVPLLGSLVDRIVKAQIEPMLEAYRQRFNLLPKARVR